MTEPRTLDELIAFVEKEFECRVGPAGRYGKWDECDPIKHPYYTLSRSAIITHEEVEDCDFDLLGACGRQAIQEVYRVFLELMEVAPIPRLLIWRYPQKILLEQVGALADINAGRIEVRTRIAVPNLDWIPLDLNTPEGTASRRITLLMSPNTHG